MDELDDNDIIDYHDDGDSDYTLDTADSEEDGEGLSDILVITVAKQNW